MFWTLVLTAGFMVAEVVGGIAAGSLALLADAGHMLTDTASLTLAWIAFRIGRRPHDGAAPTATTASRCWRPSSTAWP